MMLRNFQILVFMLVLPSALIAQDWANLEHFKSANDALVSLGEDQDRVVFMGNSITIGWQQSDPEYFQANPYVNRGISGQTTPQMLLRFRQDVIDIKATVVVILAGTNDIAENTGPITQHQIMGNIKTMAQLAEAHEIKVVLCSVLPAYDYPWKPGLQPNIKIPKLNSEIKAYAEQSGHRFVDYFSAMADEKNGLKHHLGDDGVHPNREGYDIMKPLLEKALVEILSATD